MSAYFDSYETRLGVWANMLRRWETARITGQYAMDTCNKQAILDILAQRELFMRELEAYIPNDCPAELIEYYNRVVNNHAKT